MKQRSKWLFVALIPLLFVSCDRQTTAHVFLTVAFNAQLRAAQTRHTSSGLPAGIHFDYSRLTTLLDQLRQLRQQSSALGDLRNETTNSLLAELVSHIDVCRQSGSVSSTEATLLREIKWLVLSAGEEIFPRVYREQHGNLERELFGRALSAKQAGLESAQRFIHRYLVQQAKSQETARVLTLHTLAYPDCEMNVELYLTTVEQFSSRSQIPFAVAISKQGLDRCAGRSGAELLQRELDRIYAAHQGAAGVPMNFAGPLLSGGKFELKSTRGHPVLVVFWASWCDACREQLPSLRDLHQRYRAQGLHVVGVSLDNDQAELTAFLDEHQIDWPLVFTDKAELTGWDNPIAKYYRVSAIPHVTLLNQEGIVVAAQLRDTDEVEQAVARLLAADGLGV